MASNLVPRNSGFNSSSNTLEKPILVEPQRGEANPSSDWGESNPVKPPLFSDLIRMSLLVDSSDTDNETRFPSPFPSYLPTEHKLGINCLFPTNLSNSNLSNVNVSLCGSDQALTPNETDEYQYDYLDSIDTLFWSELAPPLVVYSVTYVLGVAGNFLLIFTIVNYQRLKSTTNVFLGSLATADLLLILICIPVKISRLFSFSWTLGYFLCKVIYYMQAVSTTCSVYTMTAMSLERYYAIVHPMQAQYRCTIGKAKAAAFTVWFLSFTLASPILLTQVHMPVGMKRPAYWCVRDFDSAYVWPAYETYNLILVLLLPVVVMASAYSAILNAVFDMAISRRRMMSSLETPEPISTRQLSEDKTVRQVVRMLLVVVFLFIACWGPILVLNVLQAYSFVPEYGVQIKHWRTALDLLSYCNSCMNPVVYGFMSKNFRKAFKRALCSIIRKERHFSLSRSDTFRIHYNRTYIGEAKRNGGSGHNRKRLPYDRNGRRKELEDFRSENINLQDLSGQHHDIAI